MMERYHGGDQFDQGQDQVDTKSYLAANQKTSLPTSALRPSYANLNKCTEIQKTSSSTPGFALHRAVCRALKSNTMDSALLQQPIQSIIVEEKKSQQEDVGLAELFLQQEQEEQEEQEEFLHQCKVNRVAACPQHALCFI